jgi:hypothetical protein
MLMNLFRCEGWSYNLRKNKNKKKVKTTSMGGGCPFIEGE